MSEETKTTQASENQENGSNEIGKRIKIEKSMYEYAETVSKMTGLELDDIVNLALENLQSNGNEVLAELVLINANRIAKLLRETK